MDRLLSVQEAAEYLGISTSTVYRYYWRGLLPYTKVGHSVRIRQSDLELFIKQGKRAAFVDNIMKNALPSVLPSAIEEEKGGKEMARRKKSRLRTIDGAVFIRRYKSGTTRVFIEFYNAQDNRIREIVRSAATLEEGEVVLAKRAKEERDIKFGLKHRPRTRNFAELIDEYVRWAKTNKRSWETDMGRLIGIREHIKDKPLDQITSLDVEKYKEKRLQKVKPATVNKGLQVLSKMFNLAIQWGCMKHNPVKGVKRFDERPFRRTRILSKKEEQKLFKAILTDNLRSMVIILLNTGLRRKELLQLTWDCVDFDKRELYITDTKTNRFRFIPTNQTVYSELQKRYRKRKDKDLVYVNPATGNGYVCIRKSFERACERAKINDLILHDLRRTFATRLLEKGVDIVTVSQLLGHTSITTTQIYCMSSPRSKHDAVAMLDGPKSGNFPGDLARMWPAFQEKGVSNHSPKSQYQWN
jgi:excisionase family DNA binding protein